MTQPYFPKFLDLPDTVQDLTWSEVFPTYRDFSKRRIDIIIRFQPIYVPKTWIEPWYMYPRKFVHGVYNRPVVTTTAAERVIQRQHATFQLISRSHRDEFRRINNCALQLGNGIIIRIIPARDQIFLDMASLFCLWMYDNQTVYPNSIQRMTGYDQIQNLLTDAESGDIVGIRALREDGRRILGGIINLTAQVRPPNVLNLTEDQRIDNAANDFRMCYHPRGNCFPLGDRTRYRRDAEFILLEHQRNARFFLRMRFFTVP